MTTAPQREKRGIRCGWCIDGKHELCILAVEMAVNDGPVKTRVKYPWTCPCEYCEQNLAGRTRCTLCNRRGMEIDANWHCVNEIDCIEHRKRKRANDPMMKQIDEIRAEIASNGLVDAEDPRLTKRPPTRSKAKSGQCLCCGESTRGGKFLPGHDSRYVSRQALEYVRLEEEERRAKVYDTMEALGPALHAKFIKTVEKLRA
jgi:hypothetical protein